MANEIRNAFQVAFADGPSTNPTHVDKAEARRAGETTQDQVDAVSSVASGAASAVLPLQSAVSSLSATTASQDGRIAALEDSQGGSLITAATWTTLLTINGTVDGQTAEVPATDAGTHSQATSSGYNGSTVANAGRYSWNSTWSRWVWDSADGLSLKANKTETVKTRVLDTTTYRADKGLSLPGSIDLAEAKPGDASAYIEPDAVIISPKKPLVFSTDQPIIIGDDADERFGTDPASRHPFINGRGVVPPSFRDGTVVADSAGFLRAMDSRTPRYAGEWAPEFEFIKANDPPSVLFDTTDDYYAVRTFQLIAAIECVGSRLWAAFWGSSVATGEGPPSHIIVKYSDDDGVTWIEHAYIAYVDPDGNPISTKRCFDPRLFLDQDGLLWVLVPVSSGSDVYDYVYGTFAFSIRDASGPKPIWSKPFQISPYGVASRPYFAGQQVYVPIDYWRQQLTLNPGKAGKHVYELDTRRRAALRVGTIPDVEAPGFDETAIVELNNGDQLAVFRTAYGQTASPGTHAQYFSTSADEGRTWSAAAVFSQIPGNPPSRAGMRRTPAGRIAVIFNSSVHPARTDLTIALSEDEGLTFPYSRMIDGGAAYSGYPDMTFGSSGQIYAIWDGRALTGMPITMASVDEADIVSLGDSAPVTRHVVDSQ